jgi:hypothetical protein
VGNRTGTPAVYVAATLAMSTTDAQHTHSEHFRLARSVEAGKPLQRLRIVEIQHAHVPASTTTAGSNCQLLATCNI